MDFEKLSADVETATNINNSLISRQEVGSRCTGVGRFRGRVDYDDNNVDDGFEELFFSKYRCPSSQCHCPTLFINKDVGIKKEKKKDVRQKILTANLQQSTVKRLGPKGNLTSKTSERKNHRRTRRSPDQTLSTQIRRMPEIPTQVFRVVCLLHHRQFLRYVACFSKSKKSKSFVKR